MCNELNDDHWISSHVEWKMNIHGWDFSNEPWVMWYQICDIWF
jgi:hypothetical protein